MDVGVSGVIFIERLSHALVVNIDSDLGATQNAQVYWTMFASQVIQHIRFFRLVDAPLDTLRRGISTRSKPNTSHGNRTPHACVEASEVAQK